MRAHLLNWILGPAFLGAMIAYDGLDPKDNILSLRDLFPGLVVWAAIVVAAASFYMVLIQIVFRFEKGHLDWAAVRLAATLLPVKGALLLFVLVVAVGTTQLAGVVFGGWRGGWGQIAEGGLVRETM